MLTHIRIVIDESDLLALAGLARQEFRNTRQQAAVIIHEELERRGLIQNGVLKTQTTHGAIDAG